MNSRLFLRYCWFFSFLFACLFLNGLPRPVQAAAPADAVNSLDDVQQAVVQIESVGTFLDPKDGQPVEAWGGSGFIISPDGIAVTNNHVVAGAAYLKVYVAGEKTPHSAHVLGVSECSDLAVIQIDGDHFAYLSWFDQPVKVGLDVYTAGFPLGDPEFTLTKGIIAKAKANGDSSWASVDHVLQHDASINPGNSGGPLIDPQGRVIGINYAGNKETNQYFAIAGDIAQPIVKQLRTHKNLLSMGLNGQALTNGKDFSGVWVASVASGSPADKAGVKPGDFILALEKLKLGDDGTMKTYCDILRSHTPDDTLGIKVLRDNDLWEGQLNGTPLHRSNDQTPTATPPSASSASYHYAMVDDAAIHGQFPREWADRKSDDWLNKDKKVIGKSFVAAPDVDKLSTSWTTPGVFVRSATGLQEEIDIKQWLDANDVSKNCTYLKRVQHKHSVHGHTYTGAFDIWENCDNTGSAYAYLVAVSEPRGQLVTIGFISTNRADTEAWGNLVQSFYLDESEPTPTPTAAPTDTPESVATPTSAAPVTATPIASDDVLARLTEIKKTTPAFQTNLRTDEAKIDTSASVTTSHTFSEQGLDTAVKPAHWMGWSLAYITVKDFLLDTAVKTINGPDDLEYGVLFRYVNADNYYFFAISSQGSYRLSKLVDGESEELIGWTDTSIIHPGKGAVNQLGVLAEGAHFSLLINEQVVAQMDDDSFTSGQVALVAGNFDQPNAHVVFDHLTVWKVGEAAQTETDGKLANAALDELAQWTQAIKATTPLFQDNLQTNTGKMDGDSDENVERSFTPQGLTLLVKQPKWIDWSLAHVTADDFFLETQVSAVNMPANADYGLVFRYKDNKNFYQFGINPKGEFALAKLVDGKWTNLINWTANDAIKIDDEANQLAVLAKGAHIILLINNVIVGHVDDDAFTSGRTGLAIETFAEGNAKATFDHITLWKATEALAVASANATPPTPTPTASAQPVAVVKVGDLIVRGGPGPNYPLVAHAHQGDQLLVIGQVKNCAWLKVNLPVSKETWVIGGADYVDFQETCSNIPEAKPKPVPTYRPNPNKQGCLLFQNNLNAELTITFTSKDGKWNKTFKVGGKGSHQECFAPGEYTYTLDAPPPWGSSNGRIDIAPGSYRRFPVNAGG
ncbi:MAG: trypsin-like peptidase domain-containing protein [Caldilineaceae bacterium]